MRMMNIGVARVLVVAAVTATLPVVAAVATSAPTPAVTLGGKGLAFAGGGRVAFGVPRAAAMRGVAVALGAPLGERTIADCGQGNPMREARFKGGLTLTFLAGHFSGWTLEKGGATTMRTARGIGLGATRAALKAAYPSVSVDDSSLGATFSTDDEVSGFLPSTRPGAKVESLYAGETCMAS